LTMADERLERDAFLHMLRQAYAGQDALLRERYARSLPMQDALDDRWERARRLGFGEGASIYNSVAVYGDVKVGANTWIGPYVLLDGSGGLTIGSTCSISAGAHIYTHDTVTWALSGGQKPYRYQPVSIDDRCYIGSQVVIAAGVKIGKECVVSANSFVNHNVTDRTVVGGVPARRIGEVRFDGDEPTLVYDHRM
jgi:acetyltransferase-like isoleucine patch superfamily enzyme